jgi:hypothetical protein
MEKARKNFIVQFILSSSDRWIDRIREQEFRRLAKELGDRTPQPLGQYSAIGRIFL